VLVAHLDAANTGWIWHPSLVALGAAHARRNRAMAPVMAPVAGSLVAVAAGALLGRGRLGRILRGAGAAGLAAALSACLSVGRGETVPGASDNASGVAALLEIAGLLGRAPLRGVEVMLLACGGEEAGMGGMRAFLDEHAGRLSADCLVLGIDTLGAGTPIVCSAEGAILTHRYDPGCVALVEEGAARADEQPPERWRIGAWTDPILARFAGLPAASLLSVGPGYYPNYHHPTDTADRVDLDCVRRCIAIALGTAERYSERVAEGSWPSAAGA
jgi:Zn-dependent M28 family amino/carboxypeptidase